MDLNFGEILIDQSSRAFYDDYDDLNLNKRLDRPQWKWAEGKTGGPKEINRLIIVEGVNAPKIVQTYVVQCLQPLCSASATTVFELANQDILCVTDERDLNYYSSMTEMMGEFVKVAKNCIVVSLQPAAEYKSDKIPDGCIIRGINSSLSDIPALMAPNFISGVGAGVASMRSMCQLPFECYIVFVDIYDEQTVKTILGHLKKISVTYDESVRIKPLHHKSDLYM